MYWIYLLGICKLQLFVRRWLENKVVNCLQESPKYNSTFRSQWWGDSDKLSIFNQLTDFYQQILNKKQKED